MPFGSRTLTARCLRLVLLLTLTLGAMGCTQIASLTGKWFMMTPEQEIKFGAQVARQVEKREQLVTDPMILNYVRDVGIRIVRNSPPCVIPIRFFVVKDDSINAFAIPGGNIYVNTGLIKAADDEAELAAVIAHEVGHVCRRHSARQVSNTELPYVIQQIIAGDNSSQTVELVNSVISKGSIFNFTSQDEYEADSIAAHTLYSAGYNPRAMTVMFEKLAKAYGDTGPTIKFLEPIARYAEPITRYASSHPPMQERAANVEQVAAALPPRQFIDASLSLRRVQGRMKQLNLI